MSSFVAMKEALETSLLNLSGSTAILGIVLHLTVFRTSFPVENHLYNLLGLYLASVLAISYAYFSVTEFSALQILARLGTITTSFNAGLVLSISIYRLFFHRLRRFPGPRLSALTRFYDCFLAARNVQYNVEIEKLHNEYGDVFRTGPRDLCIVRKSAVNLIYGPKSECLRSTWFIQVSSDGRKSSLQQVRNEDDHRKRRKAWDRGFSIKSLSNYESRVKAKADLFLSQINANPGKPFDATAWSMFYSFDVMGDVGFGKEFNNLTTAIEHPAIKGIHDHMTILGVLVHVPWLINMIGRIPGAAAPYSGFFKWCADEIENKRKAYDPEKYPSDIISWLLKAVVDKDVSASPTEASLHEDSRLVIIAGSETTATVLATALYFLAKYPTVLTKLQRQLDEAMPGGANDWTYNKIKEITFIDDIIQETLRLRPAVMTGTSRVTPEKGLQVDEIYIPGDVHVFVPIQLIQTDERYYKDSKQFIPERWGERKSEMNTDEAPFMPFSLGPYNCPGKGLAMLTLRIAISKLAQAFDISFAPGETGETFEKGALDTFTTGLPPVHVQFRKR